MDTFIITPGGNTVSDPDFDTKLNLPTSDSYDQDIKTINGWSGPDYPSAPTPAES